MILLVTCFNINCIISNFDANTMKIKEEIISYVTIITYITIFMLSIALYAIYLSIIIIFGFQPLITLLQKLHETYDNIE